MATQMITAYIGNKKVIVPKGIHVPGATPKPTGAVAADSGPMIDAYIGNVAVKVPKEAKVPGASPAPKKAQSNAASTANPLHSWVDSLNLAPEQKAILKIMSDDQNYVANKGRSDAEIAKDLEGYAKQAEIDISPYYEKMKSQDLDALKTKMGDLRQSVSQYTQNEALNYKQRLKSAKEALAANGKTFSGTARTQLGNESAIGGEGVEGDMPQARRYAVDQQMNSVQMNARDMGLAAEQKYGSQAIGAVQEGFGQFKNPYDQASGNLDYQKGRMQNLYQAKRMENGAPQEGYIRSGDQTQYASGPNKRFAASFDVARQAAIDKEKNRRASQAGYTQ